MELFELNTSLHLRTTSPSTSNNNNNEVLNLDLFLERASSTSSSPSSPLSPSEPRVFSCTYCKRKFFSSQALGGHQNAHKLERTLAKKSREQLNVVNKAARRNTSPKANYMVSRGSSEEEIDHIDLSLRL